MIATRGVSCAQLWATDRYLANSKTAPNPRPRACGNPGAVHPTVRFQAGHILADTATASQRPVPDALTIIWQDFRDAEDNR